MFAFAFFISQSQKYGDIPLAANSVLMQFFLIAGFLLDGLATSAEQLTGSSVGAGNRRRFTQAFWVSLAWNVAIATLCSAVFMVFGVAIVDFVTTSEPVRTTAYQYLPYAIATPVAGVLAFHLDGVFMGATWTKPLRNMMLGSVLIYLVSWQFLTPTWGNHGLWAALLIFLAARGITLGAMVPRMMRTSFSEPE